MKFKYLKNPSNLALILANSVPLLGVLFYNWSAFNIIILYWLEGVVIVFFNTIKVGFCDFEDVKEIKVTAYSKSGFASSSRSNMVGDNIIGKTEYAKPVILSRKYLPLFYGLGHLIFIIPVGFVLYLVFFIFGPYKLTQVLTGDFIVVFVILAVSHGFSFFYNFIGQKEYLSIRSIEQILKTESGLLALYIALLIGAWAMPMFYINNINPGLIEFSLFDASKNILIVIVIVKTKFDLKSHIKRHKIVLNEGSI